MQKRYKTVLFLGLDQRLEERHTDKFKLLMIIRVKDVNIKKVCMDVFLCFTSPTLLLYKNLQHTQISHNPFFSYCHEQDVLSHF